MNGQKFIALLCRLLLKTISEHTCTKQLILGTKNPQDLIQFFMLLICIFLNINEYGKNYDITVKLQTIRKSWRPIVHTIFLVVISWVPTCLWGSTIKENECNYGLIFHGNPASLFYEVDTCSQISCRYPTVIMIKSSN